MSPSPSRSDAAGARAKRADAVRNRTLVVDAATELFEARGLSVTVQEIARRAGVGTGTVSRHFPTKSELAAEIMRSKLGEMTALADELSRDRSPGDAFVEFFRALAEDGARNRGLAALAGMNFDLESLRTQSETDMCGRLEPMLERAQSAGAIRGDVDYDDVLALLVACMSRETAVEPITDAVLQGLRS